MKFLCLHGRGSNSQIFEMQTAAIRYELGSEHIFDFVEGNIECEPSPGMAELSSPQDKFFRYIDDTSSSTVHKSLDELQEYIQEAGPFDAIMAFSEAAGLAAALLMRYQHRDALEAALNPLVKFAVFFSGGVNETIWEVLRDNIGEEKIGIPTANFWGELEGEGVWGMVGEQAGKAVYERCNADTRDMYIHTGGHEVPGGRMIMDVRGCVGVIRKTLDKVFVAM